MRSNVTQYDLIAPTTLDAILQILSDSPDHYTPIAGGTELMVALGAGRLQSKKLISLWNLEELRFIEITPDAIILGAGTTFTDIRNHAVIAGIFHPGPGRKLDRQHRQPEPWHPRRQHRQRQSRRRHTTGTPRLRRRAHHRL